MCDDFTIQFLSNLTSGSLLAVILFLLSDYLFKVPNLDGHWLFTTTTEKSSYKPYENMTLVYKTLIWVEGKNVHGTTEKIFEDCNGNKREYVGNNRKQCKITGHIKKCYLTKDKIIIHIEEVGEKRLSSTIHLLKMKGKRLEGSFISTIADSAGTVIWEKQ